MGITIYWGSGSMFAWRVLITLEEKDLQYESKLLSFSEKEHKTEKMLALNPRGELPVLTDGDVVVCESGATCLYLQSAYPDSGAQLVSADKAVMAETFQRMYESLNILKVSHGLSAFDIPNRDEEKFAKHLEAIRKELRIWEGYLAGKDYLVGGQFSLADVFLFPMIATSVRLGADLTKSGFPALAGYYGRLSTRSSIEKTTPPHWKDSEGSGILKGL